MAASKPQEWLYPPMGRAESPSCRRRRFIDADCGSKKGDFPGGSRRVVVYNLPNLSVFFCNVRV
jgi:hypothetical protein